MPKHMKMTCNGTDGIDYLGLMLTHLVSIGYISAVKKILTAHPELINFQEPDTRLTSLMIASGKGYTDIVELLLGVEEIDCELCDFAGRSAVEHARIYPNIVSLIMRHRLSGAGWDEPNLRPI